VLDFAEGGRVEDRKRLAVQFGRLRLRLRSLVLQRRRVDDWCWERRPGVLPAARSQRLLERRRTDNGWDGLVAYVTPEVWAEVCGSLSGGSPPPIWSGC